MATETTIDRAELERRFCATDMRPLLRQAYYRDCFAHYTDGRVMIWHPSDPFENAKDRPLDVAPVRKQFDAATDWQPMPAIECNHCGLKDHGIVHDYVCDECNGLGESFCSHCEHTAECRECDGQGTIHVGDCPDCEEDRVPIGPANVSRKYLARIFDLPGVEIANVGEQGDMIAFRAGELRGLIMGIKQESHR